MNTEQVKGSILQYFDEVQRLLGFLDAKDARIAHLESQLSDTYDNLAKITKELAMTTEELDLLKSTISQRNTEKQQPTTPQKQTVVLKESILDQYMPMTPPLLDYGIGFRALYNLPALPIEQDGDDGATAGDGDNKTTAGGASQETRTQGGSFSEQILASDIIETMNDIEKLKTDEIVDGEQEVEPEAEVIVAASSQHSLPLPRMREIVEARARAEQLAAANDEIENDDGDENIDPQPSRKRKKLEPLETYRRKEDRQRLHGFDCPCCEGHFKRNDELGVFAGQKARELAVDENGKPRKLTFAQRNQIDQLNAIKEQMTDSKQKTSRHRRVGEKPKTPEGFWSLRFDENVKKSKVPPKTALAAKKY